jgi:ATP synthase F1 gamma subunit
MKPLSIVKKDLEFNSSLSSLLEVLKNISVSQYRALESRMKTHEKLKTAIYSFLELIDPRQVDHPFLVPRNKSQIVVAVTSDSGLLGGLNHEVVYTALAELEKIPGRLVVIGERGKMVARDSGVPIVSFSGVREEEQYAQMIQLRKYLVTKFFEDSVGYLKVVYPRPVTFTVQKIEVISFLPFHLETVQETQASAFFKEVIFESRSADIVEYLIFTWLGQKLSEIFILSRLAEFAARFVHLEGSCQRMKEMDKKLRLEYFRIRHELIDRNMRELFSSRLIYAH